MLSRIRHNLIQLNSNYIIELTKRSKLVQMQMRDFNLIEFETHLYKI